MLHRVPTWVHVCTGQNSCTEIITVVLLNYLGTEFKNRRKEGYAAAKVRNEKTDKNSSTSKESIAE